LLNAYQWTRFEQVPPLVYQLASGSFVTASVLNMLALAFEDSVDKQQLALLTMTIKAIACHSHLALLAERPILLMNAHGSV
jgi:hypothetical protein